jgi:hypothetical protein
MRRPGRTRKNRLGDKPDSVIQHIKDARDRYGVTKRTMLTVRALFDGSISFADIMSRKSPFLGLRAASVRLEANLRCDGARNQRKNGRRSKTSDTARDPFAQ